MIETPRATPCGRCWSQRGLMATAALAFASLMAVAIATSPAGAASEGVSGRLDGLGLPTEDQGLSLPVPAIERPAPLLAVCPVDRPRRYIDDFGHARWGGGFHRHQGIDIMAPRGTPIRAPFDGTIEKSTSSGGGLGVYLRGKHGFVFNAHLDRFGKVGRVKVGDIIGYVGNSGNAIGGSPHDHFEWHPGGGQAVNPFKLLNAVCRGRATPGKAASARAGSVL
jgi:murein DD-endopeptidase MepM/ murein hydrolase activator NlpD